MADTPLSRAIRARSREFSRLYDQWHAEQARAAVGRGMIETWEEFRKRAGLPTTLEFMQKWRADHPPKR